MNCDVLRSEILLERNRSYKTPSPSYDAREVRPISAQGSRLLKMQRLPNCQRGYTVGRKLEASAQPLSSKLEALHNRWRARE